MVCVDGNHEIQTLSACTTNQALTKCIRLRRPVRRSQDPQTQRLESGIQFTGIDAVAVVNDELVAFISSDTLSELLQRPQGGWMLRHVHVNDAPCSNLHDHQYIEDAKCRRHHNEEVRSNDRFGMIAHKGHPPLSRRFRTLWILRHIPTNRAWRNLNSNLQQELIGDSFPLPKSDCSLPSRQSTSGYRPELVGRPFARDFHFQNSRNPFRCQRINVSGLTTVRTSRQSNKLAR